MSNLDLVESLTTAKVLLLSAGTSGCNMAKKISRWGIRNLTFVRNGRVSYSNHVCQKLFDSKIVKMNYGCSENIEWLYQINFCNMLSDCEYTWSRYYWRISSDGWSLKFVSLYSLEYNKLRDNGNVHV